MKKTIYISVPMAGRTDAEISADIRQAMEFCTSEIFITANKNDDYRIIEPQELRDNLNSMVGSPDKLDYWRYLSYDIETMLRDCNAVMFCKGWRQSKGCRLEHAAAEIYGKEIIYL